MFNFLKIPYEQISFNILLIICILCIGNNVKGNSRKQYKDTSQQLKLNALTNIDRQVYTLNIDSGKFVKGICDPAQLVYSLIATIHNNSNDTLKYIDWTGDPNIWCIDKSYVYVAPSNFYPCSNSINHNYITCYTILPHQSTKVKLNILVNSAVDLVNNKFKIGVILQRMIKNSDFWQYQEYFLQHQLYNQTINIIWSNTITMSK